MSAPSGTPQTCSGAAAKAKELGNQAFSAGRFDEACTHFSEAIRADPQSALLRSNRAGALASLGRHAEALADGEVCVQLQPTWWKGYTRRGHAEFNLGRYGDSEKSFKEALRLQPANVSVAESLHRARQAMEPVSPKGLPQSHGPRGAGDHTSSSTHTTTSRSSSRSARTSPTAPSAAAPAPKSPTAPGAAKSVRALGGKAPVIPPPPPPITENKESIGDFKKMSAEEVRHSLGRSVEKMSDAELDKELLFAKVAVPRGASRAEKVALFLNVEDSPAAQIAADKVAAAVASNGAPKTFVVEERPAAAVTPGEILLERRKRWLEEWSAWEDERIVQRLARLGIDGDGLPRTQLIEQLLEAEMLNLDKGWASPRNLQRCGIIVTAVLAIGGFCGLVAAFVTG